MRRSILTGLSILTLLAAPRLAQAVEAPETDPPSSADPARTITLIHLNDLHANLVSHLDMVRVAPEDGRPAEARVEMRGGVARIATLVRQIRDDSPHSLLLNVGDT
jgi:2',3'-cyclic-nucleotide 2'-phosphodiesterase (5'-nucleotidase family)